jgi:hypothetical protein
LYKSKSVPGPAHALSSALFRAIALFDQLDSRHPNGSCSFKCQWRQTLSDLIRDNPPKSVVKVFLLCALIGSVSAHDHRAALRCVDPSSHATCSSPKDST